MKRSPVDRLRTIVNASLRMPSGRSIHRFTQKELAEQLGVSVRTLRRFKNVPGYELSPRTLERIAKPVVKIDSSFRAFVRRTYHVPNTPVVQIPKPTEFPHGRSLTFDVNGWTLADKQNLLRGYFDQLKADGLSHFKRGGEHFFSHFTLYVKLPKGMVYVKGDANRGGLLIPQEGPQREDETQFYSSDPRHFGTSTNAIDAHVRFHNDAGRNIERVYIYIPAKKRKGEQ